MASEIKGQKETATLCDAWKDVVKQSTPTNDSTTARLPSRRFLWISGALATVMILATAALRWGPQWVAACKDTFTDEVVQCRVVLDDLTGTVRLEEVTRKGKVQVRKQEAWVKDNRKRQREIFLGMKNYNTFRQQWIVRVGGDTSFMYVDDAYITPLETSGTSNFLFEIVGPDGKVSRLSRWDLGETWDVTCVAIDIHNQKRLSRFLRTTLERATPKGSAGWIAYLNAHGIDNVDAVPFHNGPIRADREDVVFGLKCSRHTRMIDYFDAYSKLTAIGISDRNIICLRWLDRCVESPEERE